MEKKTYLYVANWKMYLSHTQTDQWLTQHINELNTCAAQNTVILCPSFTALELTERKLKKTVLMLGAQDCSSHACGPHTGQISAQSLAELGCAYCLVGHSELRARQNNQDITQKIQQLAMHNITPILCISTPTPEQCVPALQALSNNTSLIIAYEPLHAVGTGIPAKPQEIEQVYATIAQILKPYQHHIHYQLLYGGSVTATNTALLKHITMLDGFLIGYASTNAHEFINIINAKT